MPLMASVLDAVCMVKEMFQANIPTSNPMVKLDRITLGNTEDIFSLIKNNLFYKFCHLIFQILIFVERDRMKRTNKEEEEEVVDPLMKRIRDRIQDKERKKETAEKEACEFVKELNLLAEYNVEWSVTNIEENLYNYVTKLGYISITFRIDIPSGILERVNSRTPLTEIILKQFARTEHLFRKKVVELWNQK